MEAIILAGGLGSRLREYIPDLPKPMAPVNGKPFLFYTLNWLSEYRIGKIVLSVGFMAESISAFFGSSFNGIPVEYASEPAPLGTGGAVRFAMNMTSDDDILVVNGDTYFPVDLDTFYNFHRKGRNMFSVALRAMKDFSRYGSVEYDGNTVTRFNEKKYCADGVINGGIYIINRSYLESLQLPEKFSLETDLLEKQVNTAQIKCRIFDEPFIDIGIPEDYLRAGTILKH